LSHATNQDSTEEPMWAFLGYAKIPTLTGSWRARSRRIVHFIQAFFNAISRLPRTAR